MKNETNTKTELPSNASTTTDSGSHSEPAERGRNAAPSAPPTRPAAITAGTNMIDVGEDGVVIFDRRTVDAWIQSDLTVPLDDAATEVTLDG